MNRSPSLSRALYLVNLLVAEWRRWKEEVCCCWRGFAAPTEAPNVAVGLRDGDDDGGAGSAPLLTADGEGLDGMNKSHGRLDKTREGNATAWVVRCGEQRGMWI